MKKLITALLASALSLVAVPAFAWDQKAMNAQIDATNFLMDNDCSATLIAPDKLLTANHCVTSQFQIIEKEKIDDKTGEVKKIKVKISVPGTVSRLSFAGANQTTKQSYVYKVLAHDYASDLAVVQTKVPAGDTPAPIACIDPQRGDKVWAVGNPDVVLYASVTTGIVNSVNRDYQSLGLVQDEYDPDIDPTKGFIQHTALISPGSSGGALFNDNGELIGVNVRGGGGWSLAVTLDDIREFLTDNGVTLPNCP